jgi:beta-phosphoglucomutase family hydrolase
MTEAIDWRQFHAALFDMDGVLTRTASLHAKAWKHLFDDFFRQHAPGSRFRPFDEQEDYRRYVDGRLREDGVRSMLASREISLPEGSPDDTPECHTIAGLAKKKDHYFAMMLKEEGVALYDDGVAFLHAVRKQGLKTAVVSASRHCKAVLESVHLLGMFNAVIDGEESRRQQLPGKPDPASFLAAAKRLDESPGDAIVLEDALAGVEAGCRGGFGLVIGVDRLGQAEALHTHGGRVVVSDLKTLLHTKEDERVGT